MSCGCDGINDPYFRLYKTTNEQFTYTFTFPTTITSINTFYNIANTASTASTLSSLVVTTPAVNGCSLQVTISAGWDFTDYTLVFILTDSNGQTREKEAVLLVRAPLNWAGTDPSWGGNLVNF